MRGPATSAIPELLQSTNVTMVTPHNGSPVFHVATIPMAAMKRFLQKVGSWEPVDWAVGLYATLTGSLILIRWTEVAGDPVLLLLRADFLVLLLTVPGRGSSWKGRSGKSKWVAGSVGLLRFLRYSYPLILIVFFFEEAQYTVNCLYPENPYWFEAILYRADGFLFGQLPAVGLAWWSTPLLDEASMRFTFPTIQS